MATTGSIAVSDRVRDILAGASIEDRTVRIVEKLSRDDYTATAKVLGNLGGTWSRKAKGTVFDTDPTDAIRRIIETGEAPRSARTTEGYVATPESVAARLVAELGPLEAGARVLEPSAGDGALVRAAHAATSGVEVWAVEPNTQRAQLIDADMTTVITGRLEEFLHRTQRPEHFDAVIMNPPFAVPGRPSIWIDHVRHAWSLLRPGGRLVAIVPNGFTFRTDRKHTELRDWHARYDGDLIELPEDAFAAQGTRVRAVLLTVDKPQDWTPEDDQPTKRRGKPTPEEQEQRRAEDRELKQAAAEALDDQEYLDDLAARLAKLPPDCRLRAVYSPRNQVLVFAQADALGVRVTGHLATYREWKAQGRVPAGATGLRIVAGCDDNQPNAEKQDHPSDAAEAKRDTRRFWMTTRFDFSQTTPIDGGH
ncbi:class I SAM-dependent methyltransferase [Saccharopolyspora sp. K220]|uniref:methyltransferase n=1 Tax=Saccharopolyspora soli TaxID=2926618 RepID=UPI001F58BF66|nr:class I SAM-dependent methyltransferase [Saccharopolyspora soli]MCI2423059.1 class I SAM-dependent methyltransferase [Saccharopolyspora soli]